MMKETVDTGRRLHVYSASDERVVVVLVENNVEKSSEWTLRDGSNRVLRRFTKDVSAVWHWKEDYIYAEELLVAAEVPSSERVRHFHLDHLGTPRLITGNGGVRVAEKTYDPFGGKVSPATDDFEQLEFTGHERDTPSLDYMHARYYQPDLGRFLSVDPAPGVPETPRTWNRYAYVTDNPINSIDPDGKFMSLIFFVRALPGTEEWIKKEAHLPPKTDLPDWLVVSVLYSLMNRPQNDQQGPNPRMSGAGGAAIASHEGFYDKLYEDVGGHCTIGYGHLVNLGPCGAKANAQFGEGITEAEGQKIFAADVARVSNPGLDNVTVTLSQGQIDAVASLTFNIGAGALSRSTVLRELNAGNFGKASVAWLRWNTSSKKYSRGLYNRRIAEMRTFWGRRQ
jgi:RHS repeat-associated protein